MKLETKINELIVNFISEDLGKYGIIEYISIDYIRNSYSDFRYILYYYKDDNKVNLKFCGQSASYNDWLKVWNEIEGLNKDDCTTCKFTGAKFTKQKCDNCSVDYNKYEHK